MKYSIKAFIRKDGPGYFAECLEVEATAKGITLDETVESLRSEICLSLCGKDLSLLGLVDEPTIFMTIEDVPLPAKPLLCPAHCAAKDRHLV